MKGFLANRSACLGGAITLIVIMAVAAGPLLSTYSPTDMDFPRLVVSPELEAPFRH
jgi:hypothetical protein